MTTAFYEHIRSKGGMSRANPELIRLAEVTGFHPESLYKIAWGQRKPGLKCIKALVTHCRNKKVTEASFQ